MTVIPDNRPTVEFTSHPEGTPQLRMSFAFEAADDYGLKSVKAIIRRADGVAVPGGSDELAIDLPFPGRDRKHVKGRSNHDLTSHVWAGLPVLIHLEATDVQGQTGLSEVLPAVLPERRFNHPLAKALVGIRKHMTADDRSRRLTILKLDNLSEDTDLFSNATGAYLGVRVIRARLTYDHSVAAIVSAQKMMWDIALSVEEGLAALAGRDLMAAEKALREAMERGADLKELERLMDEVQRALDQFMTAMLRELQMRGQEMPVDPDAQILGTEDLKALLDQAREMMRQGSMEGAKQLMAELRRMLENLRSALAQGRQNPKMREAQQAMGELRDIIRRQQGLLDESFKHSQEGAEFSKEDMDASRAEQEALRRKLGEMMQKFNDLMGQVPEQLGNAEQAMREAEQALGAGKPSDAIGPQTRALEELQKGAQSGGQGLAQRFGIGRQLGLRRGFGPGMGQGFGDLGGPMLRGLRPGARDPFGRPIEEGGTGTATGSVELPTQSEMQRAREILKELRDRAGDLWRPEFERQYIDRLLKQF